MESKTTRNKKGLMTFNMLNMIPRLIFLIIVLISFFLAMNALIKDEPDTRKLESDLLAFDMIYSPEGISYFDSELNRIVPGTISLQDFKHGDIETRLNIFFNYGSPNRYISSRITLLDYNGQRISFEEELLESVYHNKGEGTYGYSYWEPLALQTGNNPVEYFIRVMPVQILDEDQNTKTNGNLIIEVIMPK